MKGNLIFAFLLSISALLSSNALAVTFNDGGVHDVDYLIERIVEYPEDPGADPIVIQEGNLIIDSDAPNAYTTVNLLEGGHILRGEVRIENQGCLNMYGGTVEWADVKVRNNGTFNMYNGSIQPWSVQVWDDSIATIYDGTVDELHLDNNGHVEVMGGEFTDLVQSFGYSHLDIYGGIFNTYLAATGHGTITLYGSFNLPYGTYMHTSTESGSYDERFITGELASGQTITDLRCINLLSSTLVLAPVPEPATMVLLGLGGLMLRKRKA